MTSIYVIEYKSPSFGADFRPLVDEKVFENKEEAYEYCAELAEEEKLFFDEEEMDLVGEFRVAEYGRK